MPKPFKELEDEEPDLAYIIRLYSKEFSVNDIASFEDDPTSTIRLGMPGEMASRPLDHKPCFVVAPFE